MYTSPFQNACTARRWPVIVDLIETGSRVHINGPWNMMPLASAAGLSNGFENSCLYARAPRRKALDLLLEKSPTLRVKPQGLYLFKRVIYDSLSGILCLLLKANKPAYGIDEAVDELDNATRYSMINFAETNNVILDKSTLYNGRMCCPLGMSILYVDKFMHAQCWGGYQGNLDNLSRQFAILRLLLDARVNVCRLGETFKQLLRIIRYRLNSYFIHSKNILEYGNQVLDAVELDSTKPRRLIELCRSRVRHVFNVCGLYVHHIRSYVGHTVEKYLLHGHVPELENYMAPWWISFPHSNYLLEATWFHFLFWCTMPALSV